MKSLVTFISVLLFFTACGGQYPGAEQDGDVTIESSLVNPGSSALSARVAIDCPVGLVSGLTLDEEFGPGTSELTNCLENHKKIQVVYAINRACRTVDCNMAYGLNNISNAIDDYEITHGLLSEQDYELAAVFYASGSLLVLDNNAAEPFSEVNPFQDMLEALIDKGVHVYLCQNSARHMGIVTANLIDGVEYVTSGVTAIADFQLSDYALINP